MALVIDILSWGLAIVGSFFLLSGAIGLLRMPDFFSRVHAASLIDTIAPLFIIAAMLLQFGFNFKLLAIACLLLFVNPAATHALCIAAHRHVRDKSNS